MQTNRTSSPQQTRSLKTNGKNRNENCKENRNETALPAPQADNPPSSSEPNRNNKQDKPFDAPINSTILVSSIINHMEEYSAPLPNTNYTVTQHYLSDPQTNRNHDQGKPLQKILKPTTPASSQNNNMEEYSVPSPTINNIAREEPPLILEPIPKPQLVGKTTTNAASPLDLFYTEDVTPPSW